ncbi:MAG TPA: GNAT family N-acetyltransferase [Syntrophales bacterium]|nr:GNAT family N-acetyltransferase [Syntrophales bacterium]
MIPVIAPVHSDEDKQRLDNLFWEVLWKPLGFPRDVRGSFGTEGEKMEFAAFSGEKVIGGVAAFCPSPAILELRHIAVLPECQGRGIGTGLVKVLIEAGAERGSGRMLAVARNTSARFFRKLGFNAAPVAAPENPDFSMHGIFFIVMEKHIGKAF